MSRTGSGLVLIPLMIFISCSTKSLQEWTVRFMTANGLQTGSSVTCRGVTIGFVENIRADQDGVLIKVKLDPQFKVRTSDQFKVVTVALSGEKGLEVERRSPPGTIVPMGQVLPGTDETDADKMLKGLEEIISADPIEREVLMKRWRSWMEVHGYWPRDIDKAARPPSPNHRQ
ncbi:MAG: MlaD family protein [Acidobacteriota bacterium]